MARPSKLTPQLRAKLCGYFERGHTIEGATGLVGIHKSTYFDWLERGHVARAKNEQGEELTAAEKQLLALVEAVELARNHGEGWLFEEMLAADRTSWQRFATALERTRPDRWRRRAAAEYMQAKPAPERIMFTFDPEKLSTDELEALRELLEKAAPLEE